MTKYPKIDTLFERGDDHKVDPTRLRLPEFAAVRFWMIEEKIDGTNVRISWDGAEVRFGGRTDNAQMPAPLFEHLLRAFQPYILAFAFPHITDPFIDSSVTLFGEGYGPTIQKGGGKYRLYSPSFRLFDVLYGRLWLTRRAVADVAVKLGVRKAPVVECENMVWNGFEFITEQVKEGFDSLVAKEDGGTGCKVEGVVARSEPLLLDRMGRRVMWKLKTKDFPR